MHTVTHSYTHKYHFLKAVDVTQVTMKSGELFSGVESGGGGWAVAPPIIIFMRGPPPGPSCMTKKGKTKKIEATMFPHHQPWMPSPNEIASYFTIFP